MKYSTVAPRIKKREIKKLSIRKCAYPELRGYGPAVEEKNSPGYNNTGRPEATTHKSRISIATVPRPSTSQLKIQSRHPGRRRPSL